MPRFVLLYHDCPPHYPRPSHWDFMLEADDSLRTWALKSLPGSWRAAQLLTAQKHPQCPSAAESNEVPAEELGRHRREYLDFEGEISDDRGHVIRIAAGTFSSDLETPDVWRVTLGSDVIEGQIELQRAEESESCWTLRCLPEN